MRYSLSWFSIVAFWTSVPFNMLIKIIFIGVALAYASGQGVLHFFNYFISSVLSVRIVWHCQPEMSYLSFHWFRIILCVKYRKMNVSILLVLDRNRQECLCLCSEENAWNLSVLFTIFRLAILKLVGYSMICSVQMTRWSMMNSIRLHGGLENL